MGCGFLSSKYIIMHCYQKYDICWTLNNSKHSIRDSLNLLKFTMKDLVGWANFLIIIPIIKWIKLQSISK